MESESERERERDRERIWGVWEQGVMWWSAMAEREALAALAARQAGGASSAGGACACLYLRERKWVGEGKNPPHSPPGPWHHTRAPP